tara:strand:+ start:74 stop:919 length:846 start_codon:yes stop_codon:yes gene_type:complete
MKPQFLHVATSSFVLWFDKWLLHKGEAYTNYTNQKLYYLEDERLPSFVTYSSAFKQWVRDSSIPGATVPDDVMVNGSALGRGLQDMKIDYDNGRVIMNTNVGTSRDILTDFAVKDFNIYITNQEEEELITESKFDVNSRFFNSEKAIPPYTQVLPAIFINCKQLENQPFSFGGEDSTTLQFRCVVMADEVYKLDGALSIFADARETCFFEIPYNEYPVSEYGDNKFGIYNYDDLASNREDKYYVTEVVTSKMSDRLNKKVLPNLFIGFIDIDVVKYRMPRA